MARAVAAAAITALTAAGLLAAPGAARAECDKGPTFTSRDSGITYVCVNGQYGESGYVQIPGNGVFRVGAEVAPGTYRSAGPDSPGGTCSWSTHRTLGASVSDMVDGNTSTGQLYVVIPSTVAAFESAGCQTWHWVSS
jgi:hypothetical protein